MEKIKRALPLILGPCLFGIALWILWHEMAAYHFHDVARQVRALPASRVIEALLLTALDYLVLTGYDWLALKYIDKPLPYPRVALASFLGYAFSHNLGFSFLSGGGARYRVYSTWGLSALEVTQIVAFCALTFWIGVLTVGGSAFLLDPFAIPRVLHLPFATVRPLGILFLLAVGGAFAWRCLGRKSIQIGSFELNLPTPRMWLAQMALSSVDWLLACAVLFVLLPPEGALSFKAFVGIFLLAQISGLISQVPGGLGVFETVLFLLLKPFFPAPAILGSLLAYRGIYYLLPLLCAACLMGANEIVEHFHAVRGIATVIGEGLASLVPQIFALATFLAGAILLFSGALPPASGRLRLLSKVLPLPFVEASHFLGSLTGVGLLILARGLMLRLDAAYHLTLALLAGGAVLSLLKGFDYEEATVLFILFLAFLPARRHFFRKSALLHEPFSPGWTAAVFLALAGSICLGFLTREHLNLTNDLWWRFSFREDTPRFLRASLASSVLAIVVAFWQLFRPARSAPCTQDPRVLEKVWEIVKQSPHCEANLALLGDKCFCFSDSEKAFIMYGVHGSNWISMGDPVGPQSEWVDLAWKFKESAYYAGAGIVFYEVTDENLSLYIDLGLTLLKIGEEARVPLEHFSMEGGSRKSIRNAIRRVEREGCIFEVIPREEVPPLLPELRRISDDWLARKNTREKGFSMGAFSEEYISYFPVAVVRKGETLLAFSNLWTGANHEELSPDLMRYSEGAPNGVMDYLFGKLMLWGKEQNYRYFNLGMAPLSGLENRSLAPLWHRLGSLIFTHGEHFYNFQGLRQFKEKFEPIWEPRYLASKGGLALPTALADVSALISGGLLGMLSK